MASNTTPTRTRRTRKAAEPTTVEVQVPTERPVEGYTVDLQAEGEDTNRSFDKLLAKDPNSNHLDFVAWFAAQSGVELDPRQVQLTLATYHEYQRSPEHKAKTQERREAALRTKAQREQERIVRAKAALAKAEAAAKASK